MSSILNLIQNELDSFDTYVSDSPHQSPRYCKRISLGNNCYLTVIYIHNTKGEDISLTYIYENKNTSQGGACHREYSKLSLNDILDSLEGFDKFLKESWSEKNIRERYSAAYIREKYPHGCQYNPKNFAPFWNYVIGEDSFNI